MGTGEYYAAVKKEALLALETAWRGLESVTLSGISQSAKDKHPMISLIGGI